MKITDTFDENADVVLYEGDCIDMFKQIEKPIITLAITSPPYNVGKEYEDRLELEKYIQIHSKVIKESHRVLVPSGSLCWQTGNYANNGEIIPIDILLWPYFSKLNMKLRNRIIWHIPHGLHCKNRFSGRYETIMWFTKGDNYYFDLDPVRIPSKYPNKRYYKGPKKGELSCNPLGKNPSDVWYISNVKHNHPEKTNHPCQ